mmetsp:Transcript_61693/g.74229  ORF Transcript_61693/g.74229 Transcript_61693/m.74229 type:complete len:228 (+) Transcript_61693:133-816(+)|eukprot:CAMPEP_0194367030 /NCGR_PEP_ID=MMETSP0174-20130528/15149_1 /TAXON_ID=216777 /ORGANISM="Proboscia alata, Strain PI-D3" /LENGTH=227 /DNA_ID=CAMNT_0039142591 /DNA_START=129 /DNA_END=812 /DNA_ORIENTATION=-
MPQSKRAQAVALTQTSKKTRDHKTQTIKNLRNAIDEHATIYLFSYENMRSNKFKAIRMDFRPTDATDDSSRIFLGKNKLLQIALGKTPEDEYADNLHLLSKKMSGSVGLLCTNKSHGYVSDYFANLAEEDFARCGAVSPRRVAITPEMIATHPVSMVEQFRKCGLPVDVKNGRVVMSAESDEFVVCKKDQVLSAEQCKLLVHFGVKLSTFRIVLMAKWTKDDYEELQ